MEEQEEQETIMRLEAINLSGYERYADFVSELSYESASEEIDFEGTGHVYVCMYVCLD